MLPTLTDTVCREYVNEVFDRPVGKEVWRETWRRMHAENPILHEYLWILWNKNKFEQVTGALIMYELLSRQMTTDVIDRLIE